jgi:hypothetical protein
MVKHICAKVRVKNSKILEPCDSGNIDHHLLEFGRMFVHDWHRWTTRRGKPFLRKGRGSSNRGYGSGSDKMATSGKRGIGPREDRKNWFLGHTTYNLLLVKFFTPKLGPTWSAAGGVGEENSLSRYEYICDVHRTIGVKTDLGRDIWCLWS